jgi:DNA-binding MarR family transcriptional regulator
MPIEPSEIGRALKRAQYRHHLALDRALSAIGVTVVQWDALRAIREVPNSSAHDLALATFQSDQSFGTLANRLVDKGLIERAPGSGRRIEHRLTAEGERMLAASREITGRMFTLSFAPLDAAERETLFDLLGRVGQP